MPSTRVVPHSGMKTLLGAVQVILSTRWQVDVELQSGRERWGGEESKRLDALKAALVYGAEGAKKKMRVGKSTLVMPPHVRVSD